MTREHAIRKLKATLGPRAYWRVGAELSSAERREKATLERLELQFSDALTKRDLQRRREELLSADPEFVALRAQCDRLKKALEKTSGRGGYYRFEVGTTDNCAGLSILHPKAYGDTWEEIFAGLNAKAGAA